MEVCNKYFDLEWFHKIIQFKLEGKYQKVIQNYRLYIKKYPNDICAISSFASFLMDLGLIDEAAEIIGNTVITDTNIRESKHYWIYDNLKLLGCQGKFDECYELFKDNEEILMQNRDDFKFIEIYLSKKLGIPLEENAATYSYTTSQVVNYSDDRAIEHILKHKSYEETDLSVFIPDFSIKDNFYKIKDLILNFEYKKMFAGIFKNVYYFKYLGCGVYLDNGASADYIKVITLQDTNEIITMFPCKNIEKFPSIDITPLIENDKQKVKRPSQIEKFNRKYNLE